MNGRTAKIQRGGLTLGLCALLFPGPFAGCADVELGKIPESLEARFIAIAESYCESAGESATPVHVTSGRRTPAKQASLMMACLSTGRGCPNYQNQEAFAEIKAAYRKSPTEPTVVATIAAQVERGCFISKHLSDYALDLRRQRHNRDAADAAACRASLAGGDETLAATLESSPHVANVVYFEGGRCDHFHVNFTGFPREGYATCPGK